MLDRLAAIAADSAKVAELTAAERGDTPVPSCPGWDLRDLLTHLGQVQQFWAENVRLARPDAPWDGDREPPGTADLGGWMTRRTAEHDIEKLAGGAAQRGHRR